MSNFVKISNSFFTQSDNGELTAVSDPDTIKGLKSGQIQHVVKGLGSKLRFDDDLIPGNSPTIDRSTGRSLSFAPEQPSSPSAVQSATQESAQQPQDIGSMLKTILRDTITKFGGSKNVQELQQKRESLLREQLLKPAFSEEGGRVLSGSQKLALMKSRGQELEPEIQAIEKQILESQQDESKKISDLLNLQKLAEGFGLLGEEGNSLTGDPTTDMKEFLYAKETGAFEGDFLDWQRTMANLKVPVTNINVGSGGMTPREVSTFNSIVDKYNKSPLTMAYDRTIPLQTIIQELGKDKKNASLQVAFIYSFIQALDTYQSAVREGEIAVLQSTQGLADRIQNIPDQIQQGTPLNPDVVTQYLATANTLVGSIQAAAKRKENQFKSQAEVAGVGGAWNEYMASTDFGNSNTETPQDEEQLIERGGAFWRDNGDGTYTRVK